MPHANTLLLLFDEEGTELVEYPGPLPFRIHHVRFHTVDHARDWLFENLGPDRSTSHPKTNRYRLSLIDGEPVYFLEGPS